MRHSPTVIDHLHTIRTSLSALPSTGHNGFEGLVQASFSSITGIPYRLSASGSQFGLDGKSAYPDPSICFECKLYRQRLDIRTVNEKLGELAIDDRGADLWAFCATTEVSAQIADNVRRFGDQHAISTIIIDWSENSLPPLAVLLAMASQTVLEFLSIHAEDRIDARAVKKALNIISNEVDFANQAGRLRESLRTPTIGLNAAKLASADWLGEALADKQQARHRLEQPLSPADGTEGTTLDRHSLVEKLEHFLSGPATGRVLCVIGDEGTGKSWSVAQTWLHDARKPMLLFIPPSLVADTAAEVDVPALLVASIIRQTEGDQVTSIKDKWIKILGQWKREEFYHIRFVVLVDGVNQRPKKEWGRTLGKLADELSHVGGQLIVTSRTSYYRNHIANALAFPCEEVEVPEWTDGERDEILAGRGIVGAELPVKLRTALCNPRILGIALRVWTHGGVSRLRELSVSRLLFEHLRMSESDSPSPEPFHETVQLIREHAAEIVAQLRCGDSIETYRSEAEINAVVEGRVFVELDDAPAQYELTNEGLTLALSFLLVDRMGRRRRQSRDMADCLDEIVEPISALDLTSEVLVGAITVTCLDDRCHDDVRVALVTSFANLQNLSDDYVHELTSLARLRILAFAKATYGLCLGGGRQPNFDLITKVVTAATKSGDTWSVVREYVHSWLRHYTIGPPFRPRAFSETDGEREEKRAQEWNKFESRLARISAAEKSIIDDLKESEGDIETLSTVALNLLSTRPRASAGKAIVDCAYALTLSSEYYRYSRDLMHFVQLNNIDWVEARNTLLWEAECLRAPDVSTDGKWALVRLLRATGDPGDAREACVLSDELSERGEHLRLRGSWRLIETYCATDPCDPASDRPVNIQATAKRYSEIEFEGLEEVDGRTPWLHFFGMARPGMARFERRVAANKHMQFIGAMMSATNTNARIQQLLNHNPLVSQKDVRDILAGVQSTNLAREGIRDGKWIDLQYRLLIAFPLLDGLRQVDALMAVDTESLLDLADTLQPIDEEHFEDRLSTACLAGDESAQSSLLLVARSTETQISATAKKHVEKLIASDSGRVRAGAIGVVARVKDDGLLSIVVQSEWSSAQSKRYDEECFGSIVLVSAARRKLVGYRQALCRMSAGYYGLAAREWDAAGVQEIASVMDGVVRQACALDERFEHSIEIEVKGNGFLRPKVSLSTESVFSENEDDLERLTVGEEEFNRRLQAIYKKLEVFDERLQSLNCDVILHHIDLDEFRLIADSDENVSNGWYDILTGLPREGVSIVHNLVSMLGFALSYRCVDRSVELFNLLKGVEPMVNVRHGFAGVSLESLAVWGGRDAGELNRLRIGRLDDAANDNELAQETLAAHLSGRSDLIESYVRSRLMRVEPRERARALMVGGFSDKNEYFDNVLEEYRQLGGFLGEVCKAAVYAYERNAWARAWYEEMCRAGDSTEFWGCSVLFLKVADGRYDSWVSEYDSTEGIMKQYWPNLRDGLGRRVKKWQSARETKLFGADVPRDVFLVSSYR